MKRNGLRGKLEKEEKQANTPKLKNNENDWGIWGFGIGHLATDTT